MTYKISNPFYPLININTSSFGFPSGEASGTSSASCGGSSKGSSSIYVCLMLQTKHSVLQLGNL